MTIVFALVWIALEIVKANGWFAIPSIIMNIVAIVTVLSIILPIINYIKLKHEINKNFQIRRIRK